MLRCGGGGPHRARDPVRAVPAPPGRRRAPAAAAGPLALWEPQVEAARAAVQGARIAVADAELLLSRTEVRAPFAGVVRTESIDLGQFVTAGRAVGRLYAADAVEVVVPLSDADAAPHSGSVGSEGRRRGPAGRGPRPRRLRRRRPCLGGLRRGSGRSGTRRGDADSRRDRAGAGSLHGRGFPWPPTPAGAPMPGGTPAGPGARPCWWGSSSTSRFRG